jgi:ADP-ribosyl-[dinitrogen reductase] hydrolase
MRSPWGGEVSGFIEHTVPAAMAIVAQYPNDFRAAIQAIIALGGDTDSTAAIVGGVLGARLGRDQIPEDWIAGLAEWPCSVAWLERLAAQLTEVAETQRPQRPVRVSVFFLFARNLGFLLIVLAHGLRRLF